MADEQIGQTKSVGPVDVMAMRERCTEFFPYGIEGILQVKDLAARICEVAKWVPALLARVEELEDQVHLARRKLSEIEIMGLQDSGVILALGTWEYHTRFLGRWAQDAGKELAEPEAQ